MSFLVRQALGNIALSGNPIPHSLALVNGASGSRRMLIAVEVGSVPNVGGITYDGVAPDLRVDAGPLQMSICASVWLDASLPNDTLAHDLEYASGGSRDIELMIVELSDVEQQAAGSIVSAADGEAQADPFDVQITTTVDAAILLAFYQRNENRSLTSEPAGISLFSTDNADGAADAERITQVTGPTPAGLTTLTWDNSGGAHQAAFVIQVIEDTGGGGGTAETGSAAFGGSGSLSASATRQAGASAAAAGAGTFSASGRRIRAGALALSGAAGLASSGARSRRGAVAFSGAGTFSAASSGSAHLDLAGQGSLTATAARTRSASLSLAGSGTLAAAGGRIRRGSTHLGGSGGLALDAARSRGASAVLEGSGALAAAAVRRRTAAAIFGGSSSFTLAVAPDVVPAFNLRGTISLSPALRGAIAAESTLRGALTAEPTLRGTIELGPDS